MKNTLLVFSIFLLSYSLKSQNTYIELNSDTFLLNPIISVKYTSDFKYESYQLHEDKSFKQIGPISTIVTTQTTSDSTSITYSVEVKYQVLDSGLLPLPILDFYFESKTYQPKNKKILVTTNLPQSKIEAIELKNLQSISYSKKGTRRIVIGKYVAYIEEVKEDKWEFLRKLSSSEFKMAKKFK